MNPFCVRFVEDYLPVIKAMIAKKMISQYNLSQNKIAEILNTTQPAISQYKRSLRGNKYEILENDEKVVKLIDKLAEQLSRGELTEEEKNTVFCRVCKILQKKD